MKERIKKGVIRNAYKHWLMESVHRYSHVSVVPLNFVGWHLNNLNAFTKNEELNTWGYQGNKYIGEKWECRVLKTGEIKEFIFRHQLESNSSKDHSLHEWDDPIEDTLPNILIDSYDECVRSKRYKNSVNPRVVLQNQILHYRINIIKQLFNKNTGKKKRGLFLILRHKVSPMLSTKNHLNIWKEKNQELYQEIMTEVSGLMTLKP